MYAKVDLDDEMLDFINKIKNRVESFEEIQELVFTQERLNKNYNAIEMVNLSLQFQEIKRSAINKILNHQKLNFPEGFLIERLIAKYSDEDYISVEEHIEKIKLNCGNNRKSNRENNRKISKLYKNFINKLLENPTE